ncbi:cell wall hydrolase [Novosphingobium sp. BL-52-GroH]|uniref:cell wall hydrolase n=1 Tax=Novosphingobium sp. BL-52-GroH TaxID=3349877 RepID=UPI003850328C
MIRLADLGGIALRWRIAIAAVLALSILSVARLPQPGQSGDAAPPAATLPPAGISVIGASAPPPLPVPEPDLGITMDTARLSNARVPLADLRPVLAAPFRFTGTPASRLHARDCLALAAWHEAGDDPAGERAVVQVVLNRVRHPAFPATVCAVVFQGSDRKTGCQFTFTCDGSLARVPAAPALARARAIAEAALSGAVDGHVGLATHYHADYVVPRWRDGLVKIARQGAHLFYRWPGYWGSPAAMGRSSGPGEEIVEPAIAFLSPAHASGLALEPAMKAPPVELLSSAAALPGKAELPAFAGPAPLDLQLDAGAAPGTYALRALALCDGSAECRVAGRIARDIAFVYVRKGPGREGAYWDCARFHRSDPTQCLPGGPALERLLAAT